LLTFLSFYAVIIATDLRFYAVIIVATPVMRCSCARTLVSGPLASGDARTVAEAAITSKQIFLKFV
jgi:hypothetical protein